MAFSAYSTTPASNTTIAALNIAEGCAPANINDAIRQLMTDGKLLSDTVAAINTAGFLPLTGGTLTGQITRSGSGGYRFNANAAQSGGATYFLPVGTALPASPAEGDTVFFY
jgi:hypothetical protein